MKLPSKRCHQFSGRIQGRLVKMELYTGAAVSVIDETKFKSHFPDSLELLDAKL